MAEYKEILAQCKKQWKEKEYGNLIEYAEPFTKEFPKYPTGYSEPLISEIYLLIAMAYKEDESRDNDIGMDYAFKAGIFDRDNEAAQWLIRQLKNEISEKNKYFKIEVEGKATGNAKGEVVEDIFHSIYGVVATTSEEALELIVEFENPKIRESLTLFKAEEMRREPNLPKGVYKTSQIIVINRE
jgi:hypothetical protein